jgi:anti-anti-sigma factor
VVTAPAFQARTEYGAARATIMLTGELDLDGAPRLRAVLSDCLDRHPRLLLLDLGNLRFCDCAGLNLLLEARTSAHACGVELAVEGVRGQVGRLFTLTGAHEVFATGGRRMPPRTV